MFLTGLDRVLNDSGVQWTARNGWRTRTAHRGGLREVRAVMWHTTETVTSAFRNSAAPTLGYVTSRAGQDWPLYNILIDRNGHAWLIAAGTAAHAGKGSGHGMPRDQANYYSFGISFDSNNNTTPVNAAQLETGARIGAAIDREWKNSIRHVMHGEWAPARRSDPTKIPGGWAALRAAISRGYWNTPTSKPSPAAPTPKPPAPKEDIVASLQDLRNVLAPHRDDLIKLKTATERNERRLEEIQTQLDRIQDKVEKTNHAAGRMEAAAQATDQDADATADQED